MKFPTFKERIIAILGGLLAPFSRDHGVLIVSSHMRSLILKAVAAAASAGAIVSCATSISDTSSSISLDRSACYGRCPVYRFTLYSDGRYVWEGRAHVSVKGTIRGWMGGGAYPAAKQLLGDARYLEFKDSYQSDSECEILETDNSTVTIIVADSLHPKTIAHYRGCRGFARQEALMQLEENLDKVFRTHRFTG